MSVEPSFCASASVLFNKSPSIFGARWGRPGSAVTENLAQVGTVGFSHALKLGISNL
jgi:hypothetical protein